MSVESAVRQRRFRNGQYGWTRNDIYDLGFIGQAVAYSDALTCDKDVRAHLTLQKIDRKYDVVVLGNLKDVEAWLASRAQRP